MWQRCREQSSGSEQWQEDAPFVFVHPCQVLSRGSLSIHKLPVVLWRQQAGTTLCQSSPSSTQKGQAISTSFGGLLLPREALRISAALGRPPQGRALWSELTHNSQDRHELVCIDQHQHPAINNYLAALGRGEHPPWPMPPPPPPTPPTNAQLAVPPSTLTTTPAATAVAAAAADSGPRGSPPGLTLASAASLMSPDPARWATSASATTSVEHRLQACCR